MKKGILKIMKKGILKIMKKGILKKEKFSPKNFRFLTKNRFSLKFQFSLLFNRQKYLTNISTINHNFRFDKQYSKNWPINQSDVDRKKIVIFDSNFEAPIIIFYGCKNS